MPAKSKTINPIKLSTVQKEEIRRLTQLANRRISAAVKLYEKHGLSVAPYDVTGGIQERSQWVSEKYAISRSVKFNSKRAYNEQLKFLRSFDPNNQSGQGKRPKGKNYVRPNISEYAIVQQDKLIRAIETVAMRDLNEKLINKIKKMNAAELSIFWTKFSDAAGKLGLEYSSDALLVFAADYFGEDIDNLVGE